DITVDYTKTIFEEVVNDVDVVIDPVGKDTLARSYGILKKGGIIITLNSRPDQAQLDKHQIRGVFLASHPNAQELASITELLDAKKIKPIVTGVLRLSDAAKADEQAETHHTRGKLVLKIAEQPAK